MSLAATLFVQHGFGNHLELLFRFVLIDDKTFTFFLRLAPIHSYPFGRRFPTLISVCCDGGRHTLSLALNVNERRSI